MWWKKDKKEKKVEKKETEDRNPFIDLFPIGSRIKYLGIEMLVVDHWSYRGPLLRTNYVDKNGVLQNAEFWLREIEALKAENNIVE